MIILNERKKDKEKQRRGNRAKTYKTEREKPKTPVRVFVEFIANILARRLVRD